MKKAYLNWSSGKDSALTLYQCLLSEEFSVKALFSTLKHDSAKIAMHEIKLDLLKKRAGAIGIRLVPFYFDASWSEAKYEQAMMKSINEF